MAPLCTTSRAALTLHIALNQHSSSPSASSSTPTPSSLTPHAHRIPSSSDEEDDTDGDVHNDDDDGDHNLNRRRPILQGGTRAGLEEPLTTGGGKRRRSIDNVDTGISIDSCPEYGPHHLFHNLRFLLHAHILKPSIVRQLMTYIVDRGHGHIVGAGHYADYYVVPDDPANIDLRVNAGKVKSAIYMLRKYHHLFVRDFHQFRSRTKEGLASSSSSRLSLDSFNIDETDTTCSTDRVPSTSSVPGTPQSNNRQTSVGSVQDSVDEADHEVLVSGDNSQPASAQPTADGRAQSSGTRPSKPGEDYNLIQETVPILGCEAEADADTRNPGASLFPDITVRSSCSTTVEQPNSPDPSQISTPVGDTSVCQSTPATDPSDYSVAAAARPEISSDPIASIEGIESNRLEPPLPASPGPVHVNLSADSPRPIPTDGDLNYDKHASIVNVGSGLAGERVDRSWDKVRKWLLQLVPSLSPSSGEVIDGVFINGPDILSWLPKFDQLTAQESADSDRIFDIGQTTRCAR
ncbi:hypothetical protein IAU59_007568 [Kwoniella sp. CBS 9459]